MIKMYTGLLLSLLAALLVTLLVACTRSDNPKNENPSMAAPSGKVESDGDLEIDLGSVNIKGGHVRRTFTLRNGGDGDLTLKGAFTSCSCTTASIETSDPPISKSFGTKLPKNWSQVIKPGQSFEVVVDFDPLFHGESDTGPFNRTVYLITDAPVDDNLSTRLPIIKKGTVTTIRLTGTVLSEEEFRVARAVSHFKETLGDFQFAETEYDFGTIKQGRGIVKHNFPFIYSGEGPVTVEGTPTSCGCTRAYSTMKELMPGDEGVLVVEFDPNFHEEPDDKFFKTISILTNPPQRERVEVRIWAQIDLDLGPNAYKYMGHKDDDEEHEESVEAH